ncbi:MAG TPA: hypothetical protein GXZ90_04475 [Clostridiales bacterium]|nr:hypothetical protein [Clostridiales bacterium]
MLSLVKNKMKSDRGALNTVETLLLLALSIFAVLAVATYIMKPLEKSAEGIGLEIEKMDPRHP